MKFAFPISLCAAFALLSGCLNNMTVIPDFETAQRQYTYAYLHFKKSVPPAEPKSRSQFRRKQRKMFEKVIERFPDDLEYTPESILTIAELLAREGRNKDMVRYLKRAQPLYPEHGGFQSRALLLIGKNLDELEEYAEAKVAYRECIDAYEGSTDKGIQQTVMECNRLYNQSHIEIEE